jgi:ribosome-binding factor A
MASEADKRGKADKGLRVKRVEGGVREELSSLLSQDLKDPRAAGAIVTRVEMAPDLRGARVHVRLLQGGDNEARRREVVGALGRAAGMLRRELTHRLGLRYAPDLKFFYDEGMDAASNVERLLAEIASEKKRGD